MSKDPYSPLLLGLHELSNDTAQQILDSCDPVDDKILFTEAHVQLNKLSDDEINSIILSISTLLDVDFSKVQSGDAFYYPLRLLRAVMARQVLLDLQFFELFNLASSHSNPHVQWGNQSNSSVVNDLFTHNAEIRERAQSFMPQFIADSFRPNLLKLGAPPSKPRAGGLLQAGQTPRLGSGGPKRDIQDENARKEWRQSPRIKVLSMAWLGLILMDNCDWQDSFSMLLVSLILNVGDDYVTAMKLQACYLLQFLLSRIQNSSSHTPNLLSRLGLHSLLLDFCKTCVHQIPSVTPVQDSLGLLAVAYPCMFQLVSLSEKNPVLEYTEIINSNILSSISHLGHGSPRTSPETSNFRVICLLIDKLSALAAQYLRLGVLVSTSRIFFTLNQIIINPFIIEDSIHGQELILHCLRCQETILNIFNDEGDREASILITNYRYDLIGSWIVLVKRLDQFTVEKGEKATENLGKCKLALENNLRRSGLLDDFEKELAGTPDISEPYADI